MDFAFTFSFLLEIPFQANVHTHTEILHFTFPFPLSPEGASISCRRVSFALLSSCSPNRMNVFRPVLGARIEISTENHPTGDTTIFHLPNYGATALFKAVVSGLIFFFLFLSYLFVLQLCTTNCRRITCWCGAAASFATRRSHF